MGKLTYLKFKGSFSDGFRTRYLNVVNIITMLEYLYKVHFLLHKIQNNHFFIKNVYTSLDKISKMYKISERLKSFPGQWLSTQRIRFYNSMTKRKSINKITTKQIREEILVIPKICSDFVKELRYPYNDRTLLGEAKVNLHYFLSFVTLQAFRRKTFVP